MDRYQKIEKNGECGAGTYGVVYKAKDKNTNEIVALKVRDDVSTNISALTITFDSFFYSRESDSKWKMKGSQALH